MTHGASWGLVGGRKSGLKKQISPGRRRARKNHQAGKPQRRTWMQEKKPLNKYRIDHQKPK